MAKRKLEWNDNKLEKFIKEGRGQGRGSEYKPWLTIQDFPSLGRVSRLVGWKTKRVHHFFSDIQTRYFYILDWADSVIDIREHYPLLDIGNEIADIDDPLLKRFIDRKSGTPQVITTTFLITIKDKTGREVQVARSVKSASELGRARTLDKFEAERRYWKSRNIDWGIVTNREIPNTLAKNIEWVHTAIRLEDIGLTHQEGHYYSNILKERLFDCPQPIRKITSYFDKEFNLEPGTGLYIFKHLVATKQIEINVNEKIDLDMLAKDSIKIDLLRGNNSYVSIGQ
ncbi:heteromeric transposase endonuclease subunit TnsA [Desulfofalx alkaliphila]|uniref:heteromeric transposase endonuclease subunit TnsA n=1 Tax=Desulfofalx alkaliphila TaxID=105483 RepID=UPI0004E1483C|nr:heteromeric transposase endonuclease subunit TnsA [Desulfofalx alkaliphila]